MDTLFDKSIIRVAVVGRNLPDILPLLNKYNVTIVDDSPDIVISYGGDGSLLGAERDFPGIPKCAVRDSKQNPKCADHHEVQILDALFAGKLKKSALTTIVARTDNGMKLTAINDIVIVKNIISSAIRYRIWLNDELFRPQIVADSLVITTPFGSTGYFQSITHGNIQTGIGLAFNNSMDLYGHTVITTDTSIKIQLLRGPATMVADNDPTLCSLNSNDFIYVNALNTFTDIYGVDTFRCQQCYNLRKDGIF